MTGGGRPGHGGDGFDHGHGGDGRPGDGHIGDGHGHGGDGLHVDGHFHDDHFRLAFHLGTPFVWYPWYSHHYYTGYYWPFSYPYYYGANWWYNDGSYVDYGNRYYPIDGYYAPMDPALAAQPMQPAAPSIENVPPSTQKDLGDAYLRAGDAKRAVLAYRSFLKTNPTDAAAARTMGLALIEEGQTKEGVAVLAQAYRDRPALADAPISLDTYRGGAEEFRDNLRRVSIYANRTASASAWLAVAVFMQAEGRTDTARAMLDRASAAGLDARIVVAMTTSLSH